MDIFAVNCLLFWNSLSGDERDLFKLMVLVWVCPVPNLILWCPSNMFSTCPQVFEAVFWWAQCRTRRWPAAKLTHNRMKSAGPQTIVLAPVLPLPSPHLNVASSDIKVHLRFWRSKARTCKLFNIIATLGKCLGLPTSQADPRWRGQGHLKRNLRAGERTPSRGMQTPRTSTTMPKPHAGPCWRWNVIEFASSQKFSIFSDILLHFAALWVGRPGRLEGGGVREEGLRWPTVGWGGPNPTGPFQPFSSEWHFYVKKNWGESRWIKSVKIIVLLAQTRAVVQVCTKPK